MGHQLGGKRYRSTNSTTWLKTRPTRNESAVQKTGRSNRRNRGRSPGSLLISNLHQQLRPALLLSCLLMVCNSRTTSYRQQTHSFSPFLHLAGAHRNQVTSATNVFKRDTGNRSAPLSSAPLRPPPCYSFENKCGLHSRGEDFV